MKAIDKSRLHDELKENIILDNIPQNEFSLKEINHSRISDESIRKMLKIILICFCFLVAELIGGIMANSLAILSDAAHLSSDLSGFVISLFSLYIGQKKSNNKYTFGYHRAEVIGALASVITIWILTVMLVKEAIDRLINPSEINAIVMLITSIFGLICNLAMFKVLHSSHHHGCSHAENESITENKKDNILNIIDDFKDSLEKSKEDARIIEDSSFHLEILDQNDEFKNGDNILLSNEKDTVEYIRHEDNHANNSNNCCRDKHKHKHQKHKKLSDRHAHHSHRTYENLQDNSHSHKEDHEDENCGHHHEEENVNIKAAIIHILGDIIQSVGVVVAALIIYFRPDLKIFDPICTFIFSIIVMMTTYNITKQCISILMEAAPLNVDVDKIKKAISKKYSQIKSIHSVNIWTLSTRKNCISLHIVVEETKNRKNLIFDLTSYLKNIHKFHITMIQTETSEEYKSLNCS